MFRMIVLRLSAFVPTLLVASFVLFIAINVVPGSAATAALGIDATPQAIARFEQQAGLDRPLHVQYLDWLGGALRGDFGNSFQNHVPVGPEIAELESTPAVCRTRARGRGDEGARRPRLLCP